MVLGIEQYFLLPVSRNNTRQRIFDEQSNISHVFESRKHWSVNTFIVTRMENSAFRRLRGLALLANFAITYLRTCLQ